MQPVPETPNRAPEVAASPESRRATCERIALVPDSLGKHAQRAFRAACELSGPRELARRVEFRYPPQRGRWGNIAEHELGSVTRQCAGSRQRRDLGLCGRSSQRGGAIATPASGVLTAS